MNKPVDVHALSFDEIGATFGSDSQVYKTLLESTRAIPWKIEWATKSFAYIGPQIEDLLGWSPDSWVTVDDWASRMHEDDRDFVVNFCVSQSMAGVDHEADYRALTKDGGYVWIRDVVHVVRTPDGEVDSLVGFMFDITERKRSEEQLLEMQKKLEAMSFEDGLTGAANRRLFDSRLDVEFESARRSGQPITLIMLDLDHFKQFNDHYGHLEGDQCLTRVAAAMKQLGRRRRDVVARYGGEEFVILLPGTDAQAGQAMADRCQKLIAGLAIPHAASPCNAMVTASIGVGTIVPSATIAATDFVDAVDRLLYTAKQNGRNRITFATL
ncbi:sensor domain-containing diguanylate cyclase [Sphingomonas sp. LY29]|uniref:GGDEF domain-containing protein n=1 Tax=Sphingomonas sp. LY29 TaxID=3095341 RepID=UPI002D7A00E5|nr:sensor domain-containing diguanylate cyclase [Sphingomonas sp. LY29]WRP25067.1 sensor domain-containing diguanylate cyclase [Sphingomonas sp. LY29]